MKKVKLVSIVLACLMALVFVSCEDSVSGANDGGETVGGGPEAALNGTWVHREEWSGHVSEQVVIFNNGNFEYHYNGLPEEMGTFTISGNYLILRVTHIHGRHGWWADRARIRIPLGSRWYSRTELISAVENHLRSEGVPSWEISDSIRDIEHFFGPQTVIFVLSGNILSLIIYGETMTYTRRN